MPYGSALFELPGRYPVGFDPAKDEFVVLREYEGRPVTAVAAFMAPAHTQLYHAACEKEEPAEKLPLYAYTPVGWREGGFFVTGVRVDRDIRQDPAYFNAGAIENGARSLLAGHKGNRLVQHLVENCVRRYGCPAAQNLAMGRWECPVPTSPSCNASCAGCISRQPAGSVQASQDRLTFVPTVDEIAAFTVPHLQKAPRAIISFGQGCEGEPLLQGDLLEAAITRIRAETDSGTINLNTNACYPEVVGRMCRAGLDSIRVSLNSAQPHLYDRYFRPKDYGFDHIVESMRIVRRYGRWISLNYFIFPGLTDDPEETERLSDLVTAVRADYIQMRNLNIDPDMYIDCLGLKEYGGNPIGISEWMDTVRKRAPWIRFGYFNPPKEEWQDR
jgi:wyosine [tRNA(Phe)-imidazoG37] synthetase (radical SAM superfamily)